jgi:hypothetical protein
MSIPGDINVSATTTTENETSANSEPLSTYSGIGEMVKQAPEIWGAIKSLFGGDVKKPGGDGKKADTFDVSGAVVWATASNTANAYFGANADVGSGGSVLVTSTITDEFKTLAVSSAEEAKVAISASMAYGKTVNTANAYHCRRGGRLGGGSDRCQRKHNCTKPLRP